MVFWFHICMEVFIDTNIDIFLPVLIVCFEQKDEIEQNIIIPAVLYCFGIPDQQRVQVSY